MRDPKDGRRRVRCNVDVCDDDALLSVTIERVRYIDNAAEDSVYAYFVYDFMVTKAYHHDPDIDFDAIVFSSRPVAC